MPPARQDSLAAAAQALTQSVVSANAVIDQNNLVASSGTYRGVYSDSQTFQAGITGYLTQVVLLINAGTGTAGTLTVRNGGGTALGSTTFGVSGNVGIGTTAPNTRLSISPGTTEAKITLYDGGSTADHYGFGVSGGQLNYHVLSSSDQHVFVETHATTAARRRGRGAGSPLEPNLA